ncbi:hypothetical protein E1262_11195 [Jiangella aurantiaca]|uniref:SGNH hydrolase-type esterase domain-containing protein n=1 Tax=Jiangella aurantiaca TaxID=2530373 RepID=A0A4R5AEU2_9ACTN|nr:GDSL-type esterase/lipase family protein [Jiangella aurantiaca]TDD69836.1 hypothetical protein E1262_11195 [Jiangella aurantiaca]
MTTSDAITLTPDTAGWLWHGWLDWTRDDEWWQPWRLPPARVGLAGSADLTAGARAPVGVRAALRTDAARLALCVDYQPGPYPRPLDVCVGDVLVARHHLTEGPATISVDLPAGSNDVDVWLPHGGWARVGALRLTGATTAEAPARRHRWVTYGSSITRSGKSAGPSETWPALVARRHDWDLTCLGFSGECHLDPLVARAIRDRPADLISLCVGINIHGSSSLNRRTLASFLSGFVDTIRDGHPDTPVVVISPLLSPPNEDTPSAAGMTLRDLRDQVAATVADLVGVGDTRLRLIDGLTILGPGDEEFLADGVHPTSDGYRLLADRLSPQLARAARSSVHTEQVGDPR